MIFFKYEGNTCTKLILCYMFYAVNKHSVYMLPVILTNLVCRLNIQSVYDTASVVILK